MFIIMRHLDPAEHTQRWTETIDVGSRAGEEHFFFLKMPNEHLLQAFFQAQITVNRTQIKKHAAIENIVRQRVGQPFLQCSNPATVAASPECVLGHDAARTWWHANFYQPLDQLFGKSFDLCNILGGKIVGIDNRIVLIGGQCLLPPSFTAQHDECEFISEVFKLAGTQQVY